MSTPDVVLRHARWSELLFGVLALLLALGLPVGRSDGHTAFLLIQWYGLALVALCLVVALRRPTRSTWAVAVVLCVCFVANVVFGRTTWRPTIDDRAPLENLWVVSPVLILMATLAQISVGIRCWQARAIWTRRAQGSSRAPAA